MKTSVYIARSLDGFIARKDGGLDWLETPENMSQAVFDCYNRFMKEIDAVVLGRGTFEKVLSFGSWPYDRKVFVLSASIHELPESLKEKVTVLTMRPREVLDFLSSQGFSSLYVDGGKVIQSFLADDCIDKMTITTVPVLIGEGIPLFGLVDVDLHFTHLGTEVLPGGLVMSHYERKRGSQSQGGRMSKVKSKDGTPIAYWTTGSGEPLVLVHGTTADHTRWAPVLDALNKKFTVHAIDRRGRGESGDTEPYAIDREFEDVAAIVDSFKEPVNLLGHSYGAICSLEASLRTRNIRKLILYEPPIPTHGPIYSSDIVKRIRDLVANKDGDGGVATFFREVVKMPAKELDLLRSTPSWKARVEAAYTVPRELQASESYKFVAERFRSMNVPTLLLLGGDSPPIFSNPIGVLRNVLPNNRVVVMPGQQHAAINTNPPLFADEVLKFLAS